MVGKIQRLEIKILRSLGLSYREIAKKLGISHVTAYYVINGYNYHTKPKFYVKHHVKHYVRPQVKPKLTEAQKEELRKLLGRVFG